MKIDEYKYKCDDCGGIFEKEWSEEEARAEQKANGWGNIKNEDMAQVCDDCYNEIMERFN